jgi:hypothetical protein
MIIVTRTCPVCQEEQTLEVEEVELKAYQNGQYVQDAFKSLTSAEREMFLSGVCEDCWLKLFPPEDD